MEEHEELVQEAIKAIARVHGDMNVPLSQIFSSLKNIKYETQSLIDAVAEDIVRQEKNND